MKFTKKFWIISVVAIVVLGIAGKWYGGRETLDEVDVEQAAVRDIVERVSASGKIQPETEVNITAEVSGQILALPVKEGDRVEKGDLLVQINPDLYEAALNRAQAAANSARSNLASAKAQHAQANAQFFAASNLASAFWQVPLRPGDEYKTAFASELNLFHWKVMAYGSCLAPPTFQ